MKVNREQFLAAALLFASTTTGCSLADRMKGEFNASQDPAVATPTTPATPGVTPVSDPGSAARGIGNTKVPVAKNAAPKTVAPIKASTGPSSEGIGPANEGVAPAKEGWAPAQEAVAPAVAPASENLGPANESWRRGKRGPAAESAGPANENWRGRPGPASETVKPVKPVPKKAKTA